MSATTDLESSLAKWDPNKRSVHCSNCRYCKVTVPSCGEAGGPIAYCAMGFGSAKPLTALIRPYGRAFRDASTCEYFDSMSEEK